jgi:sugar O-acyltransferase (sialic acid O-acetyltransferase NeuD family)
VVAFDEIAAAYPPARYQMLLPLGYHAINGLRRARFEQARALGYTCISYVSSRASTWPDLQVGSNCLIYEHAVIQPFARIGDNVIIRSAAHISHHCQVADHAFIAAGVTLGGNVKVGEQAFIGVGAIVRDNVTIGARCFIGAGAVVLGDTEDDSVYVGNPARKSARTSLEVSS